MEAFEEDEDEVTEEEDNDEDGGGGGGGGGDDDDVDDEFASVIPGVVVPDEDDWTGSRNPNWSALEPKILPISLLPPKLA